MTNTRTSRIAAIALGIALVGGGGLAAASAANASTTSGSTGGPAITTSTDQTSIGTAYRLDADGKPVKTSGTTSGASGPVSVSQDGKSGANQDGVATAVTH